MGGRGGGEVTFCLSPSQRTGKRQRENGDNVSTCAKKTEASVFRMCKAARQL